MPAANIEINGVAASDDDLPIATLVQLSNADTGGEITYLWEILDQPEGTADALSSPSIENPTFTPNKEGTYLIRLTVNDTLATEVSNLKIVGIRQLKTNERIPAAMETIEADPTKGWKPAVNRILQITDDVSRDANLIICVNPAASFPVVGDIVRFANSALIKTGLPGEERLLINQTALATVATNVVGPLGIVVGTPNGGAPLANGLVIVRRFGLVETSESGAPAVGDPVYVSDTAQPALVAGTNSRQIGKVSFSSGGSWRWYVDGSVAWDAASAFGGGIFVWAAGMPWSTVYATVNDSKPWIVLVQRDAGGFRQITWDGVNPVNLWNLRLEAIAEPNSELGIVEVRTQNGLQIGLDYFGFARMSIKNIDMQLECGLGAVANAVPVIISVDGGRLNHNNNTAFTNIDRISIDIKNSARVIGTGGVSLVELVGEQFGGANAVYMGQQGELMSLVFRGTGGPHNFRVNTHGNFTNVATQGAGVTMVPFSTMHLLSPNGTMWSIDVDNTGTLIVT